MGRVARNWIIVASVFLVAFSFLAVAVESPPTSASEHDLSPTPTPTATPLPSAIIGGIVHLQGAQDGVPPKGHSSVTVEIGTKRLNEDDEIEFVVVDTSTSSDDGTFESGLVVAGYYTLEANADGYLMVRVDDFLVIEGETIDLGTLTLLSGDIDNSGGVDQDDLDGVSDALGTTLGVADYTQDGIVDARDLALTARNLGAREITATDILLATISGTIISEETENAASDISVSVQVDVNQDDEYAPIGQSISLSGSTQSYTESYQDQTDALGAFTLESVPILLDGVALDVLLELQADGFATHTQTFNFTASTNLIIPIASTTVAGMDEDTTDGVQLELTGSASTVEIDVPAGSIPEGVTSVTGVVSYRNPRDSRDVFPGNYRATDDTLGEVQLESSVYAFIELRDQDGNPILTTDGEGATPADIRLQVPPDQWTTIRDMSPEDPTMVTVPLYTFDYENGVWLPADTVGHLQTTDGTVVIQSQLTDIWSGDFPGELYVAGQVSHFSQWNVDFPLRTHSSVCGRIVDITGSPVRDAEIRSYGTTYLSNFAKPSRTDGDGTFCDDYKKSEEEEPEDENVCSPPAVQIIEAGMSSKDDFEARVAFRFHKESDTRTITVTVEFRKQKLAGESEGALIKELEKELTGVSIGPDVEDFNFNLPANTVPRFDGHVDVHVEAEAKQICDNDSGFPEEFTSTDTREGRILLPMILTHGIMGDWANTSILGWQPGYTTVGPFMPQFIAAMANDGYREGGPYPTAYQLIYPSLDPMGNTALSQSFMKPKVDEAILKSYASKVDLVAHSMGGLVSRGYIERLGHADTVRKLVMVGTPNEGAAGSHVALEGDALGLGWAGPDTFTVSAIGQLLGQSVGARTNVELLPDYAYYREWLHSTPVGSLPPYGYPDDPGNLLGTGSSTILGPNPFLQILNNDGLDSSIDNFIIYRNNNDTDTWIDLSIDAGLFFEDIEVVSKGPGDATVPEGSAILRSSIAAGEVDPADLFKCLLNGGIHREMIGDPNIQLMARAILILPPGEEPPGCNPQGELFPDDMDRQDMSDILRDFITDQKQHSHLPQEVGFLTISGLAGELRDLEDNAPSILTNMSSNLEAYIKGVEGTGSLNDAQITALMDAIQRWGLDTGSIWNHAPKFGLAAELANAATAGTDAEIAEGKRVALASAVTDSFLHNTAQAFIQMLLNAAAAAHSEEEDGLYAQRIADLQALHGVLDQMAATRIARHTWPSIGTKIDELAALATGPTADAAVVELENLLLAVSGEEVYDSWVYRGSGIKSALPPAQAKGGGERAQILIFWNGKLFTPGLSDNGVDWQDIGVPRIATASTGYVGTPSLSAEAPGRNIGTIMLVPPEQRMITGRIVGPTGDPVPDVTVRGIATYSGSYGQMLDNNDATSGADGTFAVEVPQSLPVRVAIFHPSALPVGGIPNVPGGADDFVIGDIVVDARPVIHSVNFTLERPERGEPVILEVDASHPLGHPLVYKWERRTDRWTWESIGTTPRVIVNAPLTPENMAIRIVVTDTFDTAQYLNILPVNQSPEIDSLAASTVDVIAGEQVDLTVLAHDPDGDDLSHEWSVSPGWFFPGTNASTTTWTAPWAPQDRTYALQVRTSDGALSDYAFVDVNVQGRPLPTIDTFGVSPDPVLVDGDVTLSTTVIEEVPGEIARYDWSVQSQSPWPGYFWWYKFTSSTDPTQAITIDEFGQYRAKVVVVNDLGLSVSSDWVEFTGLAEPDAVLGVTPTDGIPDLEVEADATLSNDADGTIVNYEFDFGDGSAVQTGPLDEATHTYDTPGSYTVMLTVTDDDGLTDFDTSDVTVRTPAPPVVTGVTADPDNVLLGNPITLTAIATDDRSIVRFDWDFENDGTFDHSTLGNSFDRTYPSAGTFNAAVRAIDDDGLVSSPLSTLFFTIRDPSPPVINSFTVAPDSTVNVGDTVTLAIDATDDRSIVRFEWDFDDGTSYSETSGSALDGAFDGETTHTYSFASVFNARATVIDDDGLTSLPAFAPVTVEQLTGVSLFAIPTSGDAPLDVAFTATAVNPDDVVFYRWDFDGDGTFELEIDAPENTADGHYDTDGVYHPIVEVEYDSEATAQATIPIIVGDIVTDHPLFDAPFVYPVGGQLRGMQALDLNGDTTLDFVFATSEDHDQYAGVLRVVHTSPADGSILPPIDHPAIMDAGTLDAVPVDIIDVVVGHFNSDGFPDAAAVSNDWGQLIVYPGVDGGVFGQPVSYDIPGLPVGLVSADFDNDNNADIAVQTQISSFAAISTFFNDGFGDFGTAVTQTTAVFPNGRRLIDTGFMDGDAYPDIVLGHRGGVGILTNNEGDSATPFTLPLLDVPILGRIGEPQDVATGHWNTYEDSNTDIVVTTSDGSDGTLSIIMRNVADGGSTRALFESGPTGPSNLALDDFDGDGQLDVAYTDFAIETMRIIRGAAEVPYTGPTQTLNVVGTEIVQMALSGDLDGDGRPEVIIPVNRGSLDGQMLVFPNRGDGTFIGNTDISHGNNFFPNLIAPANPGPIGLPDLAIVVYDIDSSDDAVQIIRAVDPGSGPSYADDDQVNIVQNFGSVDFGGGLFVNKMLSAPLSNDECNDLVVFPWYGTSFFVLPPTSCTASNTPFGTPIEIDLSENFGDVPPFASVMFDPVFGEFNGDEDLDLLLGTGDHGGGGLLLVPGAPGGLFDPSGAVQILEDTVGVHHPSTGDIDGDGDPDIVFTANVPLEGETGLFSLTNNGSGSFGDPVPIPGMAGTFYWNNLIDLDGINGPDIVTIGAFTVPPEQSTPDDSIFILSNKGNGTFGPPTMISGFSRVFEVLSHDLNGDGDIDLAVLDYDTKGPIVFLGNGDSTFAPPVAYYAGEPPFSNSYVIDDLNGDGFPDIGVSAWDADALIILPHLTPDGD